jgi:hypothetical protein
VITSLVVWNTAWATPGSTRGKVLFQRVQAERPDLVCLTEAVLGHSFGDGYLVTSDPDYGYRSPANRRKVLLWSKNAWDGVTTRGEPDLPGGRLVEAETLTPSGPLRITGVCVPWRDAHVRTGRKDRRPWQDHLAFLDGLASAVPREPREVPTVLVGDLNQTLPRTGAPVPVARALENALEPLDIVTRGILPGLDRPTIDHVALASELVVESIVGIPAEQDGIWLSDHPGIVVRFRKR